MKHSTRLILIVLILLSAFTTALWQREFIYSLLTALQSIDVRLAGLMFIALFTLGSVLLIPSSLFLLAAGAVFGTIQGYVIGMMGFACGACAAALFSRSQMREFILHHLPAVVVSKIQSFQNEGWQLIAILRLQAILPAIFVNYALGLTGAKIRDIFWATFVFGSPSGLLFIYAGDAGTEILINGEYKNIPIILTVFSALLLLVFLIRKLSRRAKDQAS